MKEKLSKIPTAVKIAAPIALAAVVLLVLLFCGAFSSKTVVPDITNKNIEEAEKLLEESGLTVFVDEVIAKDDVDENTVLSQSPEAGEKVEKNTPVGVTVSTKSYETQVPDVTDYSKDLAVEKVEATGVQVEVKEEYSETVPAGTVISQSLTGKAKSSDKVTIVVSKGNEKSESKADVKDVPNIVSKDKNEAKKELADKGIGIKVVSEEYSDSIEKGKVISQKTDEKTGSVEVVVSKGSQKDAQVIVPNVVLRTQTDAKKLLESNDLTVYIEQQPSSVVGKGAVISQSVTAGTKVTPGTKVVIAVSSGKAEKDEETTAQKTTAPKTTTTKKAETKTTAPTTKNETPTTVKPTTTKPTTAAYDKQAEKKYVADFKITTDKTSAKAGDEIKVSVSLKTNYRIFTVMLPVIYDGDVFEMQNTSTANLASFLTFEGSLAKTYTTNGNWKSVAQMYKRNNNESYWTQSDVMKRWKIAYASWAVDVTKSETPVMLSNEEVIVSFTLKVKSDVSSTEGRIFISPDFQKTSDCIKGILAVGRCKNETVDLNFVDRDQTIKVDRADVKIKIG